MRRLRIGAQAASLPYTALPFRINQHLAHYGIAIESFNPHAVGVTNIVKITLRKAVTTDVPSLESLIDLSVRGLQAQDYTPAQIDEALRTVYGVDTQLIADGTYFVAEATLGGDGTTVVGCGGWSKRRTLYGGDRFSGREDSLLDPKQEAAKIRAFFVHPDWARRGIGGMVLEACEAAAIAAGFTRLEMGATLTGVPFYRIKGYTELEHVDVQMPGGATLPIIRMAKRIDS